MSPISLIILALGFALILLGLLAYTGKWTGWAEATSYYIYGAFAAPIFGVTFTLVAVGGTWPVLDFIFSPAIFFTLMGVSGVAFFVMPDFLLPKWFREGRDARREVERASNELRRTARAMRRTKRKQ